MEKKLDTHTGHTVTKHGVVAMLSRQELEFLDKLGKDSLFSTGHKLSYNDIVRALIDFAMVIELNGENADSLEKLKEKLIKTMVKKDEGGAK